MFLLGFKMLTWSGCAGRGGDVGRLDEFCKVRTKRRRGGYLLRQTGKIGKVANMMFIIDRLTIVTHRSGDPAPPSSTISWPPMEKGELRWEYDWIQNLRHLPVKSIHLSQVLEYLWSNTKYGHQHWDRAKDGYLGFSDVLSCPNCEPISRWGVLSSVCDSGFWGALKYMHSNCPN